MDISNNNKHCRSLNITYVDDTANQQKKNITIIKREIKVPDQFGPVYKQLISDYKTPNAICGYIAPAVAKILCTNFQKYIMTNDEIEEMANHISTAISSDGGLILLQQVENTMKFIQTDRNIYLSTNAHEFNAQEDRKHYLSDWVANYEISDCLKATGLPDTHFIRKIETNLSNVKHEEKRRVEEEAPFRHLSYFIESYHKPEGSLCVIYLTIEAPFSFKDTVYQSVKGKSSLHAPSEWRQNYFATHASSNNYQDATQSPTCVIDLGGHFAVAKPVLCVTESKEVQPTLLLINSTLDDYIDRPIVDQFASLWFANHYQ